MRHAQSARILLSVSRVLVLKKCNAHRTRITFIIVKNWIYFVCSLTYNESSFVVRICSCMFFALNLTKPMSDNFEAINGIPGNRAGNNAK